MEINTWMAGGIWKAQYGSPIYKGDTREEAIRNLEEGERQLKCTPDFFVAQQDATVLRNSIYQCIAGKCHNDVAAMMAAEDIMDHLVRNKIIIR